jgi:DNA-binding NtrC family response regulator
MLRFDRYLLAHSRALDLATGCVVDLERTTRARTEIPLFHGRNGRTLIDFEAAATHRVEMWEHWRPRGQPRDTASIVGNFVELLECARLGAPRAFDLTAPHHVHAAYVRRVLAREARVRGWVPVALGMLASVFREHRNRPPLWLADRSLIVFVDAPCVDRDDMLALLRLARRDTRPHVLVRTLPRQWPGRVFLDRPRLPAMVHELHESAEIDVPSPAAPDSVTAEASARWQQLLEGAAGQPPSPAGAVALARVLVARDQLFEARALADSVPHDDAEWGPRAAAVVAAINERTASRASKGWEMVDELVGVLQLCQDVEDERTALARVGAFVCERLQASSVAFVARDGMSPRVLTRVGSSAAGMDVAMRSIETGLPIAPGRPEGPVESACPVRHATEVIGALWCRWSAGMPVAPQQAATLLGVAAVAAAPSVRLALARVAPALARDNPVPELVGESAAIVAVRDAIVRAAASPFSVLIEGESGSGKELAARAIHARSVRRDRRFCALNCAALVDDLVEAELFGHARGAFTGAHADRPGLFEEASGGTLFMDEIAELGPRVQAKLLRVLQEGEVRRVGESVVRKIDVRVVAASNRALADQVAAGAFRADLWYRLDVIRIALPPLRERIEDLPLLAKHLWIALTDRTGSRVALSPATIAALAAYNWPGNIRELQNVLASMIVSAPRAGLVGPALLPAHIARVAASEREATLAVARRQFEVRYVRAALARAGGRSSDAARHLGLSRQGLAKLMGRLGIEPNP